MIKEQLIYQIALTLVDGIGAVQAKLLIEYFETAEAVFKAKKRDLSLIEGIGEFRASQIKAFTNFSEAEDEIPFIEKHHIQPFFITDKNYPQKLQQCYDAPSMLYYRGNADLNNQKSISIIGTRTNTDYGKQITEKIVEELQSQNVTIVSGLAFGIDAIAHKAALKYSLPTIGVLAHGLDSIYPTQHKALATEMLQNGGLLTEFKKNTKADKHNFPRRNRIVAGMTDATIVIESSDKGGSMITAELAFNYNRDLFAIPSRITDSKSAGCLKLIQQNKAALFTTTEQMLEELGWQQKTKKIKSQRELFIELSPEEQIIIDIIKLKDAISIDEIYNKSNLSSSSVAAAILNLELQNVLISLPGKMYKLA